MNDDCRRSKLSAQSNAANAALHSAEPRAIFASFCPRHGSSTMRRDRTEVRSGRVRAGGCGRRCRSTWTPLLAATAPGSCRHTPGCSPTTRAPTTARVHRTDAIAGHPSWLPLTRHTRPRLARGFRHGDQAPSPVRAMFGQEAVGIRQSANDGMPVAKGWVFHSRDRTLALAPGPSVPGPRERATLGGSTHAALRRLDDR